ncbi:MAG: OmpA family protein [Azoarcus sp.]|jgi:outer membrane protein OmpA-like peptidoglycan-associated protein|nr:OmpA family protein [Azoarcus sp.]
MQRQIIPAIMVMALINFSPLAHADLKIIGGPPAESGKLPGVSAQQNSANQTGADLQRHITELQKLRTEYDRVVRELTQVKKDLTALQEARASATPEKTVPRSIDKPANAVETIYGHPAVAAPPAPPAPPPPLAPLVERIRYTVPFKAYSDEFRPTPETVDTVMEYAKRADRIVVIGFSAGPSSPSNDQMAIKRAMSVRRFLISNGVPATRISVGGGTARIGNDSTEAGRNKNRRVEIDFLPKA